MLMKRISLLLMCVFATLSVGLNAQNITVKGTVTDRASGEPIPGAAVVVQGNPKVFAALRREMKAILDELSRLNPGNQLSDELTETLSMIGRIMAGMREAS